MIFMGVSVCFANREQSGYFYPGNFFPIILFFIFICGIETYILGISLYIGSRFYLFFFILQIING